MGEIGDPGDEPPSTLPPATPRTGNETVRERLASRDGIPSGSVLGRYVVLGRIGAGSMGVVYRAHDPDLDRSIALKVFRSDLAATMSIRARFVREARALARLSHPNVVPVYDVGIAGEQMFIAMELVRGVSLRHRFGGGDPWRVVIDAYLQAARGLAAAHEIGLVHRDFKPDNVLLGDDGRVRVVDFGLVTRATEATESSSRDRPRTDAVAAFETNPGIVLGTPAYMAPEALRGETVDARADQFSFCVALLQGLYGVHPRDSATLPRPLRSPQGRVEQPPRASLPEPLLEAIARGLEERPENRHRSMEALVSAIEGAVGGLAIAGSGRLASEYDIERQRHDGFVGRAGLLDRLDQLLVEDPGDRWVVVTGGPGMGKSALLAEWLRRQEARGHVVPHHFIRRGEYDWDNPATLVSSLIAQISERFPGQCEPAADTRRHPAARLAATLARLSTAELLPRGKRLVVTIDGLDEYDPHPGLSTGDPLAAFLPHVLPRGVSFLCATRPRRPYVAMLEARDGEVVRIDLDSPEAAADNDATVRAFWSREAPPLQLDPAFVDQAVTRAAGNLQHAVTLRKHLLGLPAMQRRADGIPRGLAALLAKLWERIATVPVAARGLGLLCAAREPLSLDELGLAAGWTDESERQAFLRGASELLVESRRDDGDAEYRLHHDSIRTYIGAMLGGSVIRGHHAALARHLATWPTRHDSMRRYALRHALSHRADAHDWMAAWQLVTDLAFLEARCRELGTREAEADVTRIAEHCRASGETALSARFDDLARALMRESHWLRTAPEAAAAVIWNRLRRSGWTMADLAKLQIPSQRSFLKLRHGASRESAALVRTFVGHTAWATACAVTADGRRAISASDDRTLKIWDLDSGSLVTSLEDHTGRVLACCVTPDGRHAVSGSADHTLRIWHIGSGRLCATLRGHADDVTACAVTPDGRRVISASEDRTLKLWDIDDGRALLTLIGHTGWVTACAVTPDGHRVVSASCDGTLKTWDLHHGGPLMTFEGHAGWVTACAVTPDGRRLVSASEDQTLRVWDLETGRALATLEGHTGWVTGCAVTPDGRRAVSASYDRTLRVWDLDSGRTLATFEGHAGWVTACAVTFDGRHALSASEDETLALWDLERGGPSTSGGHAGWVTACRITPDERNAVSASADHTLKLWDIDSGRVRAIFAGHGGWVNACAVTPDGRWLVSASGDATLKVWDLETGSTLATFEGHAGWVHACAISPDGRRVVSSSSDRTVRVWDIDGRLLTTLEGHSDLVYGCAISPDGRRAVSASCDRTLKIWDIDSGCLLASLEGHTDVVNGCVVTPDAERVISASFDRTLKVWSLASGRLLATLEGHGEAVLCCAVGHDGRTIVSGSHDRTLKVWDLDTYACLLTHRGDAPYVSVATSARTLVAGDDAGSVWFLDWPLHPFQ